MSRKGTNLILNELIQGLTFSVRQDSNALINAVYDGTSVLNVNVSGLDTSTITDFNIGTPSNGDVLVYNGTSGKWENVILPIPDSSLFTSIKILSLFVLG